MFIPEILGVTPTQGLSGRQFLGVLHHTHRTGPLAHILFVQFSAFGSWARFVTDNLPIGVGAILTQVILNYLWLSTVIDNQEIDQSL